MSKTSQPLPGYSCFAAAVSITSFSATDILFQRVLSGVTAQATHVLISGSSADLLCMGRVKEVLVQC